VSEEFSIPGPTFRVPRHRRGMDPATRRLAVIASLLGGTLLVVVGGWSLIGHRNVSVPVLQADTKPVRVKPENPGGLQVAGANEDILSGGNQAADGKLGPPPETPVPQALASSPPPALPLTPIAPTSAPAPAPAIATTAASPKPAAAKPTAAPEKRQPTPAVANTLVQLAAVRSETAAKSEWERLSKRLPDLLSQHRPAFSKTEHDGHTLWRVRTGGFADTTQATAFCERVRAKGASCSVADF
jgi:SPOR domain